MICLLGEILLTSKPITTVEPQLFPFSEVFHVSCCVINMEILTICAPPPLIQPQIHKGWFRW